MDLARTWIPRALAALAFALYALAAPPGLYWMDSAELTAAAARLGSPHPTGFPLYCIVARAALFVPIGELGYRLALLSAASAALAVLWTCRLACEIGRDDVHALLGAICAGATLAVSLVFFRQATVVEVYAPSAALIAGALLLVHRVAHGGDARWGLALALVCGLGLAVHMSFALLGPVVLALYLVRLYRGARWPLCAPLLIVLVAGALIAYLPVRSATGLAAALDRGHPDNATALARHLTAASDREAHAAQVGQVRQVGQVHQVQSTGGEVVRHHAAELGQGVADSVGPLALLFAVLGMIWLFRQRRERWLAAALAGILAGDALFSIWLHPWGTAALHNAVPLSLALCVAAGAGVAFLGRYLGAAGPYVSAAFGVMLVMPPALVSFPEIMAASSGDLPRDWSEAGLDATPPRGLALVHNDSTAAGLLYLTEVENARPDVAVLVRQHLADEERTRAILASSGHAGQGAAAPETPGGAGTAAIIGGLLALGRPMVWEIGRDAPPAGTQLVAGAPLSRLWRDARESDVRSDVRAALARLGELFAHPSRRDRAAARVHAEALTSLGRLAYERGDRELGEIVFTMATEVLPEHAPAWALRALAELRAGRAEQALERLRRALELAPGDPDVLDVMRQLDAAQPGQGGG